jgi:death-on-curing protein
MTPLTFEEITELHDQSIREHGGAYGILNEGVIRSAIEMPFSGFGDYEAYPSISEKAAILCFSLVQGHGFRDGNKRVGLLSLVVFLARNGYFFEVTNKEAESFILGLASGEKSKEDLVIWIESLIQAI